MKQRQRFTACRYHFLRNLIDLFVSEGTRELTITVRWVRARDALHQCSCRRRADFVVLTGGEK
jgi:hypothetical protein